MADDKEQPPSKGKAKEMESLMCSLCLDVFEEATLLRCGHTFCRKCLERYDRCHPHNQQPELESLSLMCPLCRRETNLGAEGVAGLPSNVSLNHLVDEFNDTSNPLRRLYDDRRRCTQCWAKPGGQVEDADDPDSYAVVFCCDCDVYLCQGCLTAHIKFEPSVFKGHRVVSLKEMMGGERSSVIASKFEKCSEHSSEARDFYCVDCRTIICHKCTIVKHNVRDHKIRERVEVEREFREKIVELVTQCEDEKYALEGFIWEAEQERRSAKAWLHEVIQQIDRTFADLQTQLEERRGKLKSEVKEMEALSDEKLNSLKMSAQKMSSKVSTAQDILKCREGHSCLEGDALVSHEHLLTELEELFESSQNWIGESQWMPGNITRTSRHSEFHLQTIDISKVGQVIERKWELFKEVKLPDGEPMNGLAVLSPESVLVGYYNQHPDKFSLDGLRFPRKLDSWARDATVLYDGRIAAVPEKGRLQLFDADGKGMLTHFTTLKTNSEMMVDSDVEDQIFVCYHDDMLIQVFSPDGGDPIREIQAPSLPNQVHTTKSGHLVMQSSDGVWVLDESGEEVTSIYDDCCLQYPAVDENDNMYIAEINTSKSTVTIQRYSVDGVFVETILDEIKIKLPGRHWYYMKCPSPDAIVLCTAGMMYIFKYGFDSGK